MTNLARWAVAALCTATALTPEMAAACGAIPSPFVTLVDVFPTVRVGLPRDGAVVVRGKLWGPSGGPFPFAQVRLLDATGTEIPAVQVAWYSAQDALAFRPAVPLLPRTRFSVEAVVPAGTVRPPGADGPQSLRLDFETADDLAPPLMLAGPLRVALETFEVPPVTCLEPREGCAVMNGCTTQPARRALRARIVVPAASGAVDFDGYRGWLRFTDHLPAVFAGVGEGSRGAPGNVNLMHWLEVRPGVETEILQEIVDESVPYAPCFALNLWDPAGHAVQAAPICLPPVDLSERLGGQTGAGAGCSITSGNHSRSGLLVVALTAIVLRLARQRRKMRRAGWWGMGALGMVVAASLVGAVGCGSSKEPSPLTEVGKSGPGTAGGPAQANASACIPLADVKPEECPATWPEAQAAKARFCIDERRGPSFDTFLSTEPCGGFLRYTRYLFDAGPRFCLYDPTTLALRGYRAVDGKAFYQAITCGSVVTDFGDQDCAGTACPASQAACNDLQRRAAEKVTEVASSVQQCTVATDCQLVNVPFACIDCFHLVGNDNVKAALAAGASAIEAICTEFKAAGCWIFPSGCPGVNLQGVTCQQGKCVWPQ